MVERKTYMWHKREVTLTVTLAQTDYVKQGHWDMSRRMHLNQYTLFGKAKQYYARDIFFSTKLLNFIWEIDSHHCLAVRGLAVPRFHSGKPSHQGGAGGDRITPELSNRT